MVVSGAIVRRHAVGDVMGGLFLGACIGLLFILKAIPSLKFRDYYTPTTMGT